MSISPQLARRLPLPTTFVAVNYNMRTVHSFRTYSDASRGVIRLVKNHDYDPFFCLFHLGKKTGSIARFVGRFGKLPTFDYDPNQCWGEWIDWSDDQPFIPKEGKKPEKVRKRGVDVSPLSQPAYQMEITEDTSAFVTETPTRFHYYVDHRELMVRPVMIVGRSEDGMVLYDWPALGSWCRGGIDNERYFHGAAEWAMDQLLEMMGKQEQLKQWIGGDECDI